MISMRMIQQVVSAMLRPLQRKMAMTVSRGTIKAVRLQNGIYQGIATLLDDETTDWLDLILPTGLVTRPKVGSPCVHFSVGGSRANGVLFPTWGAEQSSVPTSNVRIQAGGNFTATFAPNGDVYLGGGGTSTTTFAARADRVDQTIAAFATKYNAHTHSLTVTAGMLVADTTTGVVTGTITVGVPSNQPVWSEGNQPATRSEKVRIE